MLITSVLGMQGRQKRDYYMDTLANSRNKDCDDRVSGTEQCRKKIDLTSNTPGVSALCFIFCVAHGHCFGFHVVPLEGRKDAFLSIFTHMLKAPKVVYYGAPPPPPPPSPRAVTHTHTTHTPHATPRPRPRPRHATPCHTTPQCHPT